MSGTNKTQAGDNLGQSKSTKVLPTLTKKNKEYEYCLFDDKIVLYPRRGRSDFCSRRCYQAFWRRIEKGEQFKWRGVKRKV